MKPLITIIIFTFLLSCSKEKTSTPVSPAMDHVELNNMVFKLNQPIVLDINKDGKNDLLFYTEFQTGFPNDYSEYRVVPQIESAVVASSGVPKVFNKDENIGYAVNPGFEWIDDPVVVAKRVYGVYIEDTHWEGAWKNATDKYLGLQVTKDDKKYICWIRVSVVPNKSQLILHDAAISKEPGQSIVAGRLY